jgi:hypothetical protein
MMVCFPSQVISTGLRLLCWWGVDADEVCDDDELVEMVIPRPSTWSRRLGCSVHSVPRSEVYLPRPLTWKRAHRVKYTSGGAKGEVCFRASPSVYIIIIMDHFVDKHLNFLFRSSRSQDTLQQTHTISLQNIKHATSPLPLPSSVHRRRGRQDSATTRRTRAHPARWDVAQRSERGRWVEHVCRRSEDEDEFEG